MNTDDCHNLATCSNKEGGYDCNCKAGYTGSGVSCSGSKQISCQFQMVLAYSAKTNISNRN